MLKEHEKGSYNFKWIRCINDILVAVGRPDLFRTEPINSPNSVKMDISRTMSDLYIQEWNKKANVSSKGKQYLLYKDNLNFEKYLINVSKFYYSKIIKYRTGNHRLPVETGRWGDIPLNERKCKICTIDDIGDEYHYLFTCDYFANDRKLYLKPYFYVKPNIRKYRELFTSTNEATLIKLSKFVAILWKSFLCRLFFQMIEINYVPIYMKINHIFFVIKGQFPVTDYIPNTIILYFIVHCIYV